MFAPASCFPLVLCLLATTGIAQVTLVRDINQTPVDNPDSRPGLFSRLGSWTYFVATTETTGIELFRTQGTPGSLQLVRDLRPGIDGSSPSNLTAVGSTLFFVAEDGSSGRELWTSDGTTAGTQRVADIRAGALGSEPNLLTALGPLLMFRADDGVAGPELWRSDGTTAGTQRVADIRPGMDGADPNLLTASGNEVWFQAADGVTGRELWKSDGTAAGTTRVHDAFAAGDGAPHTITAMGSSVYLIATTGALTNALFRTDGTTAGTTLLRTWPITQSYPIPTRAQILGAHQGLLYLSAHLDGVGPELWRSDGTAPGTVLLADLGPSSFASSPGPITALGNRVYFAARSFLFATELWSSDGTTAGTQLVAPNTVVNNPAQIVTDGSALYFLGSSSATGSELFRSDGTNVTLLADIRPGVESSFPAQLILDSTGLLHFSADDGVAGVELWTSDGTTGGTALLHDVNPSTGATLDSYPGEITDRFGIAYFQADDGIHGPELWRSDGTAQGTWLVKDLVPGPASGSPFRFRLIDDVLWFTGRETGNDYQLFKSDGTAQGTVKVTQLPGGESGANPQEVVGFRGRVLFATVGVGGLGLVLHSTDGTTQGTQTLRTLPGSGSWPIALTVVDDAVYFVGSDGNGYGLWKTDGTAQGTVVVTPVNLPRDLTAVGDRLVFIAGASSARTLWVSDGSTAGTVAVPTAALPAHLTRVGDQVFFASGNALWKSDGTVAGTVPVLAITIPSTAFFGNLDDRLLLFSAGDASTGAELWRSDGTAAGTVLVRELNPGAGAGVVGPMFTVGSRRVWFAGDDGQTGPELWVTDGTAAGTRLVHDIHPGVRGSLTPVFRFWAELSSGELLISATDGATGIELFRVDPDANSRAISTSCGDARAALDADDPLLGGVWTMTATRAPLQTIGLIKLGFPDPAPTRYWGCLSYVDMSLPFFDLDIHTVDTPNRVTTIPVPDNVSLSGLQLALQNWYITISPLGFQLSNGVWAKVGR